MEQTEIFEVGRFAIFTMLKVGGPVLLIALIVGLVIALFQALTQMQEMTLSFVPKIVAIMLSLVMLMPFMAGVMIDFTQQLADRIIGLG